MNSNSGKASNTNVGAQKSSPNKMSRMTSSEYDIFKIIAIVIVMILIVIVTFWIIYKMRKGDKEETLLIEEPYIQLDDRSKVPIVVSSDSMPSSAVGNEYTFNFWIYLSDNYDATTEHKLLMYRGERESSNASQPAVLKSYTSPIVVMDKSTNKMHIAIATKNVTTSNSLDDIFSPNSSVSHYFLKTSIDYIPLQRWVNVTVMVIDNVLRVYLNGDIYSVVSTSEMTGSPSVKMNDDDLVVGHTGTIVRGFFANPHYFNHAIPQYKIRKMYNSGPITKSWLSYIGLGKYGVQSPIYKIEA